MLRILFVEASSGGVVGGSLTGLYHLIRGLPADGWRASMALYEPKQIEADLARLGVPVYHVRRTRLPKQHALLGSETYRRARQIGPVRAGFHGLRQTARLLAEELPPAAALARIIRRSAADVVHLGNGLRANFDGFIAARLTRTPVVCHIKGFEKYGARERWASGRIEAIVCMTQAVLDHCRSRGLRTSCAKVVYDAVDARWLQPTRSVAAIRAELGVPLDVPCIGMIGNVQEWKGQAVFVEAMARISARHPDLHALIVGGVHRAGQAYAAELRRRLAESNLADRVRFVGFREDVVDVVNALDAVVHASIRPEPFGRVILEAMLLGKPVIAAAAGGVPELIEDGRTGYLVPPNEDGALASCLGEVVGDLARARTVGARAREWAGARFSLSRHVGEMRAIYETITRKNGAI